MLKKTVASLGLAAAATTGAAFLMGSPASAETVPASARTTVADVQTTEAATVRHGGDGRGWTGDRYDRGWTGDRHHNGWTGDRYDHRQPHHWTCYHHRHPHHSVVAIVHGDHRR